MTKIKLCGLSRICDMEYANALMPEYIGFVFAKKSRRYVSPEKAELLRKKLSSRITPVGVFVNEQLEVILELLRRHIIEAVQLHGSEDEAYIKSLRTMTDCTVIKAFRMESEADAKAAEASTADYVLLDSGSGGSGQTFDWSLVQPVQRAYFLAGGLMPENVGTAIAALHPFAVDASSALETDGFKDANKMTAFVQAVRTGKDAF